MGNDSTFYRPRTTRQLARYRTQIPEDFEVCFEVCKEITIPTYDKHATYGQERLWRMHQKQVGNYL